MKEWLESNSLQELLRIRATLAELSDEECRDNNDLWRALAEGRLLHVFSSHPQKDLILRGFHEIEYDPVLEWDAGPNGDPFPVYAKSDTIRPEFRDSILGDSFRWRTSSYILKCVTALVSETSELPQFITPTISLHFLTPYDSGELLHHWTEAYKCRQSNLTLAGIVMIVSFMEGLVAITMSQILSLDEQKDLGKSKDRDGNVIVLPIASWSLDMLLAAGQKKLDLDKPHWAMIRRAQTLRNYVHPHKPKSKGKNLSTVDLDSIWLAAQLLVESAKRSVQACKAKEMAQ